MCDMVIMVTLKETADEILHDLFLPSRVKGVFPLYFLLLLYIERKWQQPYSSGFLLFLETQYVSQYVLALRRIHFDCSTGSYLHLKNEKDTYQERLNFTEEDKTISPWTLYFAIYRDYNGSSLQALIRCCALTEAAIKDSVIWEGYRLIFSDV